MFTRSTFLVILTLLAAGVVTPPSDARADRFPEGPPPASSITTTAASAVEAAGSVADGAGGTEPFGAALVEALGYEPGSVDGAAANPEGDCSSPVPLPASFEPACRVHDLGYDLLRLIDDEGAEIPRELRSSLDARMTDRMHASCRDESRGHLAYFGCRFMASVASVSVQLNTVRQGHGAPVEEEFPW